MTPFPRPTLSSPTARPKSYHEIISVGILEILECKKWRKIFTSPNDNTIEENMTSPPYDTVRPPCIPSASPFVRPTTSIPTTFLSNSYSPSFSSSEFPTTHSSKPTIFESYIPTKSTSPKTLPSISPSTSMMPTNFPSTTITTSNPSTSPTKIPTKFGSVSPSFFPSLQPSTSPTTIKTTFAPFHIESSNKPTTAVPSDAPSKSPTIITSTSFSPSTIITTPNPSSLSNATTTVTPSSNPTRKNDNALPAPLTKENGTASIFTSRTNYGIMLGVLLTLFIMFIFYGISKYVRDNDKNKKKESDRVPMLLPNIRSSSSNNNNQNWTGIRLTDNLEIRNKRRLGDILWSPRNDNIFKRKSEQSIEFERGDIKYYDSALSSQQMGMFVQPPLVNSGSSSSSSSMRSVRQRDSHVSDKELLEISKSQDPPGVVAFMIENQIKNKMHSSTTNQYGGTPDEEENRPSLSFIRGLSRRIKSTIISMPLWRKRSTKGDSFKRLSTTGSSLVMKTQSADNKPWEASLKPGIYDLSVLVNFPDIELPTPRHARIRADRSDWVKAKDRGSSGTLNLSAESFATIIPVEVATTVLLGFYGCTLIDSRSSKRIELQDEHVIQDFWYSKDYFKKYSRERGGLEVHGFAHVDCPLNSLDDSGMFLLGKWNDEGNMIFLTAFRVPQYHALFVPGGVIHTNDYLCGTWRTMLSWTSEDPIDHVKLIDSAEPERNVSFNIEPCNCGPDLKN